MSKKEKLLKIAKVLEEYLLGSSKANNKYILKSYSMMYANQMELVVGSKNIKKFQEKNNWIEESKITRKAKSLLCHLPYSVEILITAVEDINTNLDKNILQLIPEKQYIFDNVREIIQILNDKIWQQMEFIYELTFLQGKQHRRISDKASWKNYMPSADEKILFDKLIQIYKRNFVNHIKMELVENIIYDVNQNYDNFSSIDNIKNIITTTFYELDLDSFFQRELLKIYSMGNLFQLQSEGHLYATLQTSQSLHDCELCREIQSNEKHIEIPYEWINGYFCYPISEIIKKSLFQGNDYFTHLGCSCQFIPISI